MNPESIPSSTSLLDEVVDWGTEFLTSIGLLEDTPLRSSLLQHCGELVRLAEDEHFTPIGRGHPDKALVTTLQTALKAAGYNLGAFGPHHDGVDGDFGAATERALKGFQQDKLPGLLHEGLPAFRGKTVQASASGKLDWVTLLGLDAWLARAEGPAAPGSQPLPHPTPSPAPSISNGFIFDAQRKHLSLHFGMRMYQALLHWLWVRRADGTFRGVGYSTTVAEDYGTTLPRALCPGWPDLTGLVEPDEYLEVDGKRLPIYAFGAHWRGSGFTNCTNSQCAAFYVAAGGKSFGVKQPDGSVVSYPFAGGAPRLATRTSSQGTISQRSAVTVFQQTFVSGSRYYDAAGRCYWLPEAEGSPSAVACLGLGEVLSKRTTAQSALRQLRLGDVANNSHHAFMIGDVRYGVWVAGEGKPGRAPDYVVDQSSFIDSAQGRAVATAGRAPGLVEGRTPPDTHDCEWILSHEAEFEHRLQTFLSARALIVEGATKSVEKVEVTHFRVFSANGDRNTVHGAPRGSTAREAWRGITWPWKDLSEAIAWARFYGSPEDP